MIGVTGATGEIGTRLVRRLAGRGAQHRLIVRNAGRAPAGAGEVVEFGGYGDRVGMRRAFDGVSTLFLCSAHEAEDRVEQHRSAVDAAVAAGVGRVVYLSFVGAARKATFTFARDHFLTEQYIRASGIDFTFSRQNLYMDLLPSIVGGDDVIRGPAGAGRVAPVVRDDVADALAVLLTEDGHAGMTYTLTGPAAVTLADIAHELAGTLGRPIRFEDETLEQAYASRASYGAPAWEVEGWITTYTAIAAGELATVTHDVEVLTGHPPVGLRQYLSTR